MRFIVVRRLYIALTFGTIYVCGMLVGMSLPQADAVSGQQSLRPDIYTMYRISPGAPLSVKFKGKCLEAEDSAAHLKLVDYGPEVVLGCYKRGY